MASESSFLDLTLLTPKLLPFLLGLTNKGKPKDNSSSAFHVVFCVNKMDSAIGI